MFEGKLKKIIDRFEFLEKEMQGQLDRNKLEWHSDLIDYLDISEDKLPTLRPYDDYESGLNNNYSKRWKKLSEIDYDIISNNVTTNKFGTFSYIWDGLKVKKYEVDNNNYLVSESEYDVTGRLIYEKVYIRGDAGSFYEQYYEYDTNYRNRLLKITRSKVGFLAPQTMQEATWQENTARILYYAEGGNLLSKADITVNEFDDWLSFKWTLIDETLLQDVKITYKMERFMPYYVPIVKLSKI